MRSMWKGAVSFGLVMIPVKLYTATEQKDIAFRQVHREDGGRIRFRRFCSIDEQEVPYEDIAKGYELSDGEMVVLTDEDMADLPLPTTRNIEVVQFCPADQLDPILFNRSYYVEPETAGTRAYCLLRDALEESGKIAIAQVALRQRESLAILRARDGVLVLETLLWPDEIRTPDFGFLDDDIDVRPQELRMAGSLIESMTVDFDPEEYHDSYREAVQELVAAKTEGREVFQPEVAEADTGKTSSLADALRASLAAAKGGRLGAVPDEDDADEDEDEAPRSGRPAAATSAGRKAGPAKASTAKTGTAKTGTAKTGTAKTGTAKTGTAKAGTAKTGTAKAGTARTGTRATGGGTARGTSAAAKPAAGSAKPAARSASARSRAAVEDDAKPAAQRRPRRAS
jgi:DNA end-binding protein Ku